MLAQNRRPRNIIKRGSNTRVPEKELFIFHSYTSEGIMKIMLTVLCRTICFVVAAMLVRLQLGEAVVLLRYKQSHVDRIADSGHLHLLLSRRI